MQIIILCGGNGIRLKDYFEYIPKAMVRIGLYPAVWHIMKRYSLFGHHGFLLALGKKGELIKDYFVHYQEYTKDIEISLSEGVVHTLRGHQESDWKVGLIETGIDAMSGARIGSCQPYITGNTFMVSYSDCLADIDIKELLNFHKKSGKIATITGVIPPYREGEMLVENNSVVSLYDSTKQNNSRKRYVNGGFMVFNKKVFDYLSPFNECRLETDVFNRLIQDNELALFPHHGLWRWLDTDRDYDYLNSLVHINQCFWLKKQPKKEDV